MDVGLARRLANAIGTAKVVLMVICGLAVLAAMLSSPTEAAIVFAVWGVVSIVSIYVLFGWHDSPPGSDAGGLSRPIATRHRHAPPDTLIGLALAGRRQHRARGRTWSPRPH